MNYKQLEEMARATALALESRLMFDRKEWEMIILELAKQIQTETARENYKKGYEDALQQTKA